jgi:hypothetical protein
MSVYGMYLVKLMLNYIVIGDLQNEKDTFSYAGCINVPHILPPRAGEYADVRRLLRAGAKPLFTLPRDRLGFMAANRDLPCRALF